jgi:hypothetical protein
VEIGARDVSRNQYIVADTANKVKHETGRMIAKREYVRLEDLVETVKATIEKGPKGSGRFMGPVALPAFPSTSSTRSSRTVVAAVPCWVKIKPTDTHQL